MFVVGRDRHLWFTAAIIFGTLLYHTNSGRVPNFSIGSRYSSIRTWAFFLLPGSLLGRVGSQTKQNSQRRSGLDSSVAFVNDVDSRSMYKEKIRDEQSEKSQIPPLHKDAKTERKNTLLHSAWVIIAIVLTIVFGAVAVYYWVLFYPILCKKERKYDVMQMSAKP